MLDGRLSCVVCVWMRRLIDSHARLIVSCMYVVVKKNPKRRIRKGRFVTLVGDLEVGRVVKGNEWMLQRDGGFKLVTTGCGPTGVGD